MPYFIPWRYDLTRKYTRGDDIALDGVRHKTPTLAPGTVAVHKLNVPQAGVGRVAIYEAVAGKNYRAVFWVAGTPNGSPLPGPTSPMQPAGVQMSQGGNINLDVGNVIPDATGWLAKMMGTKYVELSPGQDAFVCIYNDTDQPAQYGLTGYAEA